MKKFKTESEKILNMMINSIYTNREIFIRELISNASDAIDKLYYLNLTKNLGLNRDDFEIHISTNKTDRILTITDNGIGMSQEELEKNLGVIAHSDSQQFKQTEKSDEISIIGQFGVGFYSAFMVAKKVEVISRKYSEEVAHIWSSSGIEGYDIEETTKDSYGTIINLYLKDDTEDEKYSEYLEDYTLESLVQKYSNYVRYKITMLREKVRELPKQEGEEEAKSETYLENETINSMIPLWKKKKTEISQEEYNEYYKNNFYDYENPLLTIHYKAEGIVNFTALLFIPAKAPYNYYQKTFEKGLKLYNSNVLISEKAKELLPDYFSFVQGVVDCDLSLNVSRETIQNNAEVKKVAKNIEKKIKDELLSLLEKDHEKYQLFFKEFGVSLKYGIYSTYGQARDLLDLVLFQSVKEDKLITLKNYVASFIEGQKYIYYAPGKSTELVKKSAQAEKVLEANYDILLFKDDVDEFVAKILRNYDEKEFKSIHDTDIGIEDKVTAEKAEHQELIEEAQKILKGKVEKVKVVSLKSHPVALTTVGEVSIEMEKVLANAPQAENRIKASKVLEINENHPIYKKLESLLKSDKETFSKYLDILYQQARLIEGLDVEDPSTLAANIIDFLSK